MYRVMFRVMLQVNVSGLELKVKTEVLKASKDKQNTFMPKLMMSLSKSHILMATNYTPDENQQQSLFFEKQGRFNSMGDSQIKLCA